MLEEFGGDILINRVFFRQFQRNFKHRQTERAHPGGAVGLVDVAAGGQGRAAIKNTDVVQPQKAALKDVVTVDVFAVDPPGEVEQQLVEHAFQKSPVGSAALFGVDFVDAPGGPSMYRRIDIAKGPFIGRQLAVGVHIPFAGHQFELAFGEIGVDQHQGQAVKGQIPGGEPGVFPLVGHGDDIGIIEMQPLAVTSLPAFRRRGGGNAPLFFYDWRFGPPPPNWEEQMRAQGLNPQLGPNPEGMYRNG